MTYARLVRLFDQPLARYSERVFDRSLYFGDERGTPILTSRLRLVVGADHLWLVPPFGSGRPSSIPLAWIVSAVTVGHGVRVEWHNQVAQRREVLMFGVRGILFYQPRIRDRLAALLLTASKSAARPSADRPSACEECGQKPVEYYALKRLAAFADVGSSVLEPHALCAVHGRKAVRATIYRNAFLGTIGLCGMRALSHASELTAFAAAKGVMDEDEAERLRTASILIPAGMLAVVAGFVLFASIQVK